MAQDLDTDDLLKFAAAGATKARDELLERHRERLKRMVAEVLGLSRQAMSMRHIRAIKRLSALLAPH